MVQSWHSRSLLIFYHSLHTATKFVSWPLGTLPFDAELARSWMWVEIVNIHSKFSRIVPCFEIIETKRKGWVG